MNDNNQDPHLEELQRKHHKLESEVADVQSRPLPDSLELRHLKRRKLAIKDEIERYKRNKSTSAVSLSAAG